MIDNKACFSIAQDTNSKARCKHIDMKYKYIQEKIIKNDIKLEYIDTDNILVTISITGIKMTPFTNLIFKELKKI